MTLQFANYNIWAVIVCIVLQMVLGALWYSPVLFGNIWLKLVEIKAEDINQSEGNKAMSFSVIPAAITVFSLSVLITISNAATVIDALIIGTIAAIGLIGMSAVNLILFEDRSVKLTILNVGYPFVALNIAAIILTLWK